MSAIVELKHAIRTHLAIHAGPTPQLAVFLVKTIDFLEDDDASRCQDEMLKLAFAIVESVALHVQQSIDQRAVKLPSFPVSIKHKGDNLLVMVGKTRQLPDKVVAKATLLREIAETLNSLAAYTKSTYPAITDTSGNIL